MTIDQPVEVRKGEELDLQTLNTYLHKHSMIGPVLGQKQFPGGYSNLTYLLRTEKCEYILRRPPAGAAIKSAHDMSREFKVLSLLEPVYNKVPKPIILCEDITVLGTPFYIMERITGLILRPAQAKDIQLTFSDMRRISESLIDNLVELHAIDVTQGGLSQLGKPEGYISRQVDGWGKRYINAQTDPIESMDSVIQWLGSNLPAEHPATLLHNDYKYDNVVLDPQEPSRVIGVLDWEMTTVGDPWMDIGASLAYWAEAGDSDLAKVFNVSWLPGNLTRKEFVERYSEKSRRTANPLYYYVFGLYKNAVIAQQIYARWKQGHSKDPRFGQLIHVIHNLASRAASAIDKNSI